MLITDLLITDGVRAIIGDRTRLMGAGLILLCIRLLSIERTDLSTTVLIRTRRLASISVLTMEPTLILLIRRRMELLTYEINGLMTVLRDLSNVRSTVLTDGFLDLTGINGRFITDPRLSDIRCGRIDY